MLKYSHKVEFPPEHTGRISCIALSPDADYMATADTEGKLIIWDVRSASVRHRMQLPGSVAQCIIWSRTPFRANVGCSDGELLTIKVKEVSSIIIL